MRDIIIKGQYFLEKVQSTNTVRFNGKRKLNISPIEETRMLNSRILIRYCIFSEYQKSNFLQFIDEDTNRYKEKYYQCSISQQLNSHSKQEHTK